MLGTRRLTLALPDKSVDVLISMEVPTVSGSDWTCQFEITWPEGTTRHYARGVDALQALHLAQQMIGAELYTSPHHAAGRLLWQRAGEGYGFPVPRELRDLLVGEDRRFEG